MIYSPYRYGRFRVSSVYGNRILYGAMEFHQGLDLVGLDGDNEITAVIGGTVLMSRIVTDHSNLTWQWGNYVSIRGDDGNVIYYCHLAERYVSAGQRVKAGDVIGIQGHTGYSFGDHLHFEVRKTAASSSHINAAEYLGIKNAVAKYEMPTPEPDYAEIVCQKCGLEQQTRDYLDKYKYANDLWRKLYEQMV